MFTGENTTIGWCNGVGLLILITVLTYAGLVYSYGIKRIFKLKFWKAMKKSVYLPARDAYHNVLSHR